MNLCNRNIILNFLNMYLYDASLKFGDANSGNAFVHSYLKLVH